MLAAGVRGRLPEVGGFQLAVKSDAFLVRTVSDAVVSSGSGNLAAAEAGVSRVRAALEGSRELRFAGGRTVTPPVELGVWHDGRDAETGTGLGAGFGVIHADPNLGLMVDAALSPPRTVRARRTPARSPGIACPRRGSMYPSLEERQ